MSSVPGFGSVISGVLAERASWRWIFWLLTILTGTYGIVLILSWPEPNCKLVGNGSIQPHGLVYRSHFHFFTRHKHDISARDKQNEKLVEIQDWHIPHPFVSLSMLRSKGALTVILLSSVNYSVRMTLQVSLSTQCITAYELNYLQAGLVYLPSGIGGAIAAKVGEWFVDLLLERGADLIGKGSKGRDTTALIAAAAAGSLARSSSRVAFPLLRIGRWTANHYHTLCGENTLPCSTYYSICTQLLRQRCMSC
jgi:MFS family permease